MAQMEESLKTGSKRTLQVVRSRKTYMAAVLALAVVLIGACGLGIVWAAGPQDVLIEGANSSGEEAGSGGGAGASLDTLVEAPSPPPHPANAQQSAAAVKT